MFHIRFSMFVLVGIALGGAAAAPQPVHQDPAIQKEAMAKLDYWIGEWEGEGWARRGPDHRETFTIHESIQPKLDGLVLLIEGRGTSTDPTSGEEIVTHHALAILSYEPERKQYRMRHYRMDGSTGENEVVLTDTGMRWGLEGPRPGSELRFNITIEDDTWREVGEISPDGVNWYPMLEMTLERNEDEGTEGQRD